MNRDPALYTVIFAVAVLSSVASHADELGGSVEGDSLIFPTEVIVISKEDLLQYNIHTLDDILEMLPAVVSWREGPPGSRSGFSIDGRSSSGLTMLLNGEPFCDPYSNEPLSRFLPISRLKRIEVILSGSPLLTGDLSSNGAINFVIEEGGRSGPMSELDFTYGRSNMRARRIWFSTPKSYISFTMAYDEYLQDAFESFMALPSRKLGDYDSRSILMDLSIATREGDDVLVRLHRYEDTYVGTAYSSGEDIRYSGFDSKVRYRKRGFSLSLRQNGLRVSRNRMRLSSLLLGAIARWSGRLEGLALRTFAVAERSVFKNTVWAMKVVPPDTVAALSPVFFDPEFHRLEGGIVLGSRAPGGLSWRGGVFGGSHSVAGVYMGWELGVTRGSSLGFTQSVTLSRRLRIPSARELFQPDSMKAGTDFLPSGTTGLDAEVTDEVSIGAGRSRILEIDIFARKERSRIVPSGSDPITYSSEGEGSVVGGRGRFSRTGNLFGFEYGFSIDLELFGKRSSQTPGIPGYRLVGGLLLGRSVFKETERLTLRWDTKAVGERPWYDIDLEPYTVHNFSASITVMAATLRFELKNVFNLEYETVPGYLMPGRCYVIGIAWPLFD